MDSNGASLGALALAGLVGSFGHCVGMCGPLVTMLGVSARHRGSRLSVGDHVLYHVSRVSVYALLGLAAGVAGSFVGLGSRLGTAAGVASLVLGATIVVLGVTYFGGFGWAGHPLWYGEALAGAMSRAVRRGGAPGVVALGALNGLLPCGLVYSALLAVTAGGSPLRGGLGMVVFGAATIPVLVTVGLGASRLGARPRAVLTRVAGALIVLVGAQLALRGAAELSLLPHLQLGGLMLW